MSRKTKSLVPVSTNGHADSVILEAKRMFMQHVPVAKIAEKIGVPIGTINTWKKRAKPVSWDIEREDATRSLIDASYAAGRPLRAEIRHLTLEQIKRGIDHIMHRPDPPNLQEIERLSIIATNIDKISRLEEGQATEITEVRGNVVSTKQAIEILMNDPFKPKDELVVTDAEVEALDE